MATMTASTLSIPCPACDEPIPLTCTTGPAETDENGGKSIPVTVDAALMLAHIHGHMAIETS